MLPPVKFAAIDIGSNAVRLLFTNVARDNSDKVHFHKVSLIRVPVRLGSDAFTKGFISRERITDLIKTMSAYKQLMEVYKVRDFLAFATSALREASNGPEICAEIAESTGINIEIIDGNFEAKAIHATHIDEDIDKSMAYLYIDVGGGSTELTLISGGQHIASQSFRIGTVRLLEELVEAGEWEKMKAWIQQYTAAFAGELTAIGTGGNINKLSKLANAHEGTAITRDKIRKCLSFLETFTLEERINILGLREDRADVIIPASNVYLSVMRWAHINKMHVPRLGLADGMVHLMYENWLKKNP